MDSSHHSGKPWFSQWNEFEKIFGPGFPFHQNIPWSDPEYVNQYVKKTVDRFQQPLQMEVNETSKLLHISVPLPDGVRREEIRVLIGRQSLVIQGDHFKKLLSLPSVVKKTGSRAYMENGILKIVLHKITPENPSYEIFVEGDGK